MTRLHLTLVDADFSELPPPIPQEAIDRFNAELEVEAELLASGFETDTSPALLPNELDFSGLFGQTPHVRTTIPDPHARSNEVIGRYQDRRQSRWSRNSRRSNRAPVDLNPRVITVRYTTRCHETQAIIEAGTQALWSPEFKRMYCDASQAYANFLLSGGLH